MAVKKSCTAHTIIHKTQLYLSEMTEEEEEEVEVTAGTEVTVAGAVGTAAGTAAAAAASRTASACSSVRSTPNTGSLLRDFRHLLTGGEVIQRVSIV